MRETPKFFLSPTQHKSTCAMQEGGASTGEGEASTGGERGKINKVPTAARIECGVAGIDGQP